MLLSALIPTTLETWLLAVGLIAAVRLFSFRYTYGLQKYNGPFLASFSNLWRLIDVYLHNDKKPGIHWHEKYGDVIRIGPNVLYYKSPSAIKDIYGPGTNFVKSDYYPVQAAVNKGVTTHTLFSNNDQTWHDNLRKSINPAFVASTIGQYEHLVDATIEFYLKELERRFAGKQGIEGSIDLDAWLLYFAFDVMGDLTYSRRTGFIEYGKDANGIIEFVKNFLGYGLISGQMPITDSFLRHNPIALWLEKAGLLKSNTFPGAIFASERLAERKKLYESGKRSTDRVDFLDKFLLAQKQHPEIVTTQEVMGLSLSTILAGSETTAITLTAIFYYVLRTPGCYSKLQAEIDANIPSAGFESAERKAPFHETRNLPYLRACVQEAFRIHPAFAFYFERIVPPQGRTILGEHIPGGTVVGCNPWVIHQDKEIFGNDPEVYRPERWLESPERAKVMDRTLFHFGAGKHICLGKHIAYLEIYKLVPSLIKTFNIILENPEKEWTMANHLSMGVQGVNVRIEKRDLTGNSEEPVQA